MKLAYLYEDADVVAVAGLKRPRSSYVSRVFEAAGAVRQSDPVELGWVFVKPSHRGQGLGRRLMKALLAIPPEAHVFATTVSANTAMQTLLAEFGFAQIGAEYKSGNRMLRLYSLKPRGLDRVGRAPRSDERPEAGEFAS